MVGLQYEGAPPASLGVEGVIGRGHSMHKRAWNACFGVQSELRRRFSQSGIGRGRRYREGLALRRSGACFNSTSIPQSTPVCVEPNSALLMQSGAAQFIGEPRPPYMAAARYEGSLLSENASQSRDWASLMAQQRTACLALNCARHRIRPGVQSLHWRSCCRLWRLAR